MTVTDEMVDAALDARREYQQSFFLNLVKGSEPENGPETLVRESMRAAITAALSLPVSNTGENAGLIERLTDPSFDKSPFKRMRREAAAALAAADARIAELEAWTTKSEAIIVNYCSQLAAEKMRAETAETLLEEAWRALAPFIRLADNVFSDGKNANVADEVALWCFNDTDITFGDLRRVRATLDRIGK